MRPFVLHTAYLNLSVSQASALRFGTFLKFRVKLHSQLSSIRSVTVSVVPLAKALLPGFKVCQ